MSLVAERGPLEGGEGRIKIALTMRGTNGTWLAAVPLCLDRVQLAIELDLDVDRHHADPHLVVLDPFNLCESCVQREIDARGRHVRKAAG